MSKDRGCDAVDFKPYFKVLNSLDDARDDYIHKNIEAKEGLSYLTLQAAGNEGVTINGPEDTLDCSSHKRNLMMVGATNAAGLPMEWSNKGDCVDINIMGDILVIPAPENFLSVSAGTSFSTPLLVRHITTHYKNNEDLQHIINDLLGRLDSAKALPWGTTPMELSWNLHDPIPSSVALRRMLSIMPSAAEESAMLRIGL